MKKQMDRFAKDILKEIRDRQLIPAGSHVVCGFSGGADSVCLLHVLNEIKPVLELKLTALHVNHGIRGEEADRDEEFCRKEAKKLGIDFCAEHVDVPALVKEKGLSEEEAARVLRYEVFSKTEHDYIAVAHHADDQAETILFNMLRGSSLKGIGGIKQKRDDLVRPLLHKSKNEILSYIERNGLPYVTDSTNFDNIHARNYLRNIVLPGLAENVNQKASCHIVKTAEYIKEADDYLREEALKKSEGMTAFLENEIEKKALIKRKSLRDVPQILRRYAIIEIIERLDIPLKDWGEIHFQSIDKAITGRKGMCTDLPGKVRLENTEKYTEITVEKQINNI